MKIARRRFSASLAGASMGLGGAAWAQAQPIEGTHYARLSQPVPGTAGGKIDVIEFFWYGCPHCNAFEPLLVDWVKRLPPDVVFRRIPVAFRREPDEAHQRIFYALEALGQLGAMHRKVFYAIHNDHNRLDQPQAIADFMAANGVDGAKFLETYNSFAIQTRARQANQLAAAYKIDGVPALGVQGRYFTSGSLAGSNDRALAVADFLVQKVRSGK